jgi:hypothetical protein
MLASTEVLLIWDRLPAHRSRLTQQFIRDQKGRKRPAATVLI